MVAHATLLADFGLVVLIWLIQLVVYPSFHHVEDGSFVAWHSRYTRLVAYIVMPLMSAQVILHGAGLLGGPGVFDVLAAVLIVLAWATTFVFSVPCHRALSNDGKSAVQIAILVRTNWIRTTCWTGVFLASIVDLYW